VKFIKTVKKYFKTMAKFKHLRTAVKVKVKLSLCLTKHDAMKAYWGVEVWLPAFLTLALEGGEWSASRPGLFTPRVISLVSH
jgi:hypothetical protein